LPQAWLHLQKLLGYPDHIGAKPDMTIGP